MTAAQRRRLLKVADFIGRLKPRKLQMSYVARTNKRREDIPSLMSILPEDMNPRECKSAACVMGWMPFIFPRHFKYTTFDVASGTLSVQHKATGNRDFDAVEAFLGVPHEHGAYLFGSGTPSYETPKQVSRALRSYAKTGTVPSACEAKS